MTGAVGVRDAVTRIIQPEARLQLDVSIASLTA
jgi:hypothetical protein